MQFVLQGGLYGSFWTPPPVQTAYTIWVCTTEGILFSLKGLWWS